MLKDKIIVITGGAGLLGQEFTKTIRENNGTCVVTDIDSDKCDIVMDINSTASVLDGLRSVLDKYGRVDALVNNAYPRNKGYGKHFFDVEYDDFCENINLNLGGYFNVSQQFAKYFKEVGQGNIINIASIYGCVAPKFGIYEGTPMTMPVEYAAIKSGLIHLTKYMASYFKGMNIRVNSISPGGIFDNQPEPFLDKYKSECLNKGMLDKSDISGTLIYLLSDMSKYVNGQNIIIDDGFTL